MGELLKFRLSSANDHNQTSIFVPFDTTWAKLKSLSYGFFNVDYGLQMESIEIIDVNNMNAIVETWTENNFDFQALDLTTPGRDLVFVIHVQASLQGLDAGLPSPPLHVQHLDTSPFTTSLSPNTEFSVSNTLGELTSTELEFSSTFMIMNNFDKNAFKKLVSNEVPVDKEFEIEQNSEFLKCCASGDATKLQVLFKDSLTTDVNFAVEGIQGMFLASSLGHLSVMELLFGEGVPLDEMEPTWRLTPLNVACLKNHEVVAKWLIERNCHVTKMNRFGSTPLHYICYHAMTSLLPVITKSNADVISEGGFSLSHYGTGVGSFPVVEHLVMLGADVNCWDSLGNYPLHYSAAAGVLESVFLLVEVGKCPVDCLNENGQTPFLVACRSGHLEIAQWLGAPKAGVSSRGGGGANVFIEDHKYCNALHAATSSGNLELITFVCSLGISVLSKTREGKLPIDLTFDPKVIELLNKIEAEKWVQEQNLNKPQNQVVTTQPVEENLSSSLEAEIDLNVSKPRRSKVSSRLPFTTPTSRAAKSSASLPSTSARIKKAHSSESEKHRSEPIFKSSKFELEEEVREVADVYSSFSADSTRHSGVKLQHEEEDGPTPEGYACDDQAVMHPDPQVDQFFKSCIDGDSSFVKRYISQHNDIYVCNDNGSQAIHFAVRGGHLDIVQLLFQAGADLEVSNNAGIQPMTVACSKLQPNEFSIVKWLTTQGVEVFSTAHGATSTKHAMYYVACCDFDCSDLIEFLYKSCPLLKYNVKVMNKAEELEWSMLHAAAEYGTVENVEAFLDIGMRLGPRLKDSLYTPLHCAVLHANPDLEMIALLLRHCKHDDVVATDHRGRTAIFHACLRGHFEVVVCLADAGFNSIAISNVAGNTCLHAACQSGNVHLVAWLQTNYPDLAVRNEDGAFPEDFADKSMALAFVAPVLHKDSKNVHEAFRTGNVELLKQLSGEYSLVDEVLTIDPQGSEDCFFWHTMVGEGYLAAVKFLVGEGAPLDVLDYKGWSPLHYAVVNGKVDLMHYFVLQQGVNIFNACGDDGSSCLHLSIRGFAMESATAVDLLTRINMATELLQLGLDVNCQDLDGNTPAHLAASCLWLDMILLLQDHGADFYMKNGDMMSVLHQVVSGAGEGRGSQSLGEMEPIIDQLISFGCDIDVRGKNNLTPFHLACVNGNVELCNYLFERGSNIRLTGGKDNLTAVHIAAIKEQLPVIEWLLSRGLRHDSINGENKTPAEVAYAAGNQEIYDWLLTVAPTIYQDRFSECLIDQLFWAIDLEYFTFASILLEEFLECGPSMTICTEEGSNLMHGAAAVGNLQCLEVLFRRGVGLEMTTSNNYTPLHVACLHERIGCVKSLIDLGANVKAVDVDGNTCLHMAVEKNNVKIAKLFCDIYETVEIQNVNGWTPLHCCCGQGTDVEMLNILLQQHVNLFKYSFDDETPFYLACKYGHSKFVHDMVVFLLTERVLVSEDILNNAISFAYENGHTYVAQWLENVQLENGQVQSPLPDASIFLIQLPSEVDDNGHMPSDMQSTHISSTTPGSNMAVFLEAIQCEDYAFANALLKSGVDANSFNPANKMYALHMACLTGNLLLVQVLADYGADLNVQNVGGLTPLHIACDRQHEDIVMFLLEMSASLLKVCNNGNTVLHMMASRGLCNAIYQLKKYKKQSLCDVGAKNILGQDPLHLAVVSGSMDTCEALLSLGCPIDGTDCEGETPLLLACSSDLNALVTLLVGRGANVNHEAHHQRRPLHAACVTGNMLVAHTLIDAGADVTCINDSGDTLLHLCGKYGKLLLLKWLLKFGLDLQQENYSGQTPRDCAMANGNDNIVSWIDANGR